MRINGLSVVSKLKGHVIDEIAGVEFDLPLNPGQEARCPDKYLLLRLPETSGHWYVVVTVPTVDENDPSLNRLADTLNKAGQQWRLVDRDTCVVLAGGPNG